jgi:hypothetical protein
VDVVEGDQREVILEVGCSFDCWMEWAFAEKLLKYKPLIPRLYSLGYECKSGSTDIWQPRPRYIGSQYMAFRLWARLRLEQSN